MQVSVLRPEALEQEQMGQEGKLFCFGHVVFQLPPRHHRTVEEWVIVYMYIMVPMNQEKDLAKNGRCESHQDQEGF